MTTDSREQIFAKLRAARPPFPQHSAPPDDPLPVVPLSDADRQPAALHARFTAEATALGCKVYAVESDEAALRQIAALVGDDPAILSWEPALIPLAGYAEAFAGRIITTPETAASVGAVRVGVTGADVALAATGSVVLSSGAGRSRFASLLPDVHIAVITAAQIVPDFETWINALSDAAFRAASNVVVISGPSKTADIAQELIKGAHGPREVHLIVRV